MALAVSIFLKVLLLTMNNKDLRYACKICEKSQFSLDLLSFKNIVLSVEIEKISIKQAEWLACWKTRDPTLNAVLLFSKTCKKDAGSKIQFSLISVYKKNGTYDLKVLIWVEARPLMKLTWDLNNNTYCFWPLNYQILMINTANLPKI